MMGASQGLADSMEEVQPPPPEGVYGGGEEGKGGECVGGR